MPKKARILVVDDDADMRAALTEALTRSGYEVETAPDGEAGLSKAQTEPYGLILTDLRMPRRDGFELVDTIKQDDPDKPVIVMTAYGDRESEDRALQAGADEFMLKPFTFGAVEKVIARLLGTESKPAKQPKKPARKERAIITDDAEMKRVLDIIDRTAASRASVLIHGESGTGKELIARYIHEQSDRADGPFIAINCAALPESLLESELFGHEKGAFTGAINKKIGKFEMASGGTILLDEITEMQLELQAKLLRVLQEKEIDRVGGSAPVPVDVRVVATTNRKVEEAIEDGKFREDLYFRLNVIPVHLPPLRERPQDVELLADYFRAKFTQESGKQVDAIGAEAMGVLKKCRWRGNVRELENVMERAVLLARGDTIEKEDLFLSPTGNGRDKEAEALPVGQTLEEMERKMILGTLDEVDDNRTKAAEMLGISIRTLRNKLNAYKETQGAD